MKKILSIVLTLAVVFGMFIGIELPVFAATSGTTGDCTWILNGTELTISGNGEMGDDGSYYGSWATGITKLVIENGVTNIGNQAFAGYINLTSVIIPDSVTWIGALAFSGCTNLTNFTIPNSVTSIGVDAFKDIPCYNDSTNWVDGVLYIGKHLIEAKESISGEYTIKDGTLTVASDAFRNCKNITNVALPNSVKSIGSGVFNSCTGLTSITIPDSVTSIGDNAFADCTGLISITLSDSITTIGYRAFYGCTGLESITIPDSVTSIGDRAFYACISLTSINIPADLTSIGIDAFLYCTDLKRVDITDIKAWCEINFGRYANPSYYAKNLYLNGELVTDLVIPNGVTNIDGAFNRCTSLKSVVIPDSVTSIGINTFAECTGLTDVWYTGSEADRQEISIGNYNDALNNATWHYNVQLIGEDIEVVDGKVKVPSKAGYFTDKNGKLVFPGEVIEAAAGDVFVPAPIARVADNAFSVRLDCPGIRARGALSKETVEAASEIGFVIVPRIAPDLSADWYVSSQYTYKQPVNKSAIYGAADEVDGYQYQLCLWDLAGVEAEDFLFAMYATVGGVTTHSYVGCVSYELVNNAVSK